jgi:Tol biopolymer transport system component
VFLRRGVLYAAEFDAARLEVRGSPEPVVETAAQALTAGNSGDVTGAGQFAVSPTGALAYVRRPVAPHPDGQLVAFLWQNQGVPQIAWMPADGTAAPEVLVPEGGVPSSWSPDGRHLAFVRGTDIWVATLEGGSVTAAPVSESPETEQWPEFSPDGRWLAFGSNASGRFEVYVQPYPGPGPRQFVSLNGGESPAWSPTGRELLFVSPPDPEGRRKMMAADVRSGPTLEVGRPRPVFTFSGLRGLQWASGGPSG